MSSTAKPLQALHFIGVDHKNSPIEIRERFAITADDYPLLLNQLSSKLGFAVILSTCNRTELYVSSALTPDAAKVILFSLFAEFKNLPPNLVAEHAQYINGEAVANHLFKVAAGLESMILGEGQILRQIKDARLRATGFTDALLNQLFQRASAAGKRVRTDTDIARGAMSVPAAALQIVQSKLNPRDVNEQNVMILGSGHLSQVCLDLLHSQGAAPRITLVARSLDHGLKLRHASAKSITYAELPGHILSQDVVLVCTAAPHFVLNRSTFTRHPSKLLVICDMSVPRNVEPTLGDLPGIELIDIDFLQSAVEENLSRRGSEISRSELILREELEKFWRWIRGGDRKRFTEMLFCGHL